MNNNTWNIKAVKQYEANITKTLNTKIWETIKSLYDKSRKTIEIAKPPENTTDNRHYMGSDKTTATF